MTTYLIIGNGAAGNAAAQAIRKHDQQGAIHIFSREKYPYYYTPALPDYLAGEKELNKFTLHDQGWYEKNRIDLHLDTEVTRIDPDQKLVVTRSGEQFSYDKLLLATGGYSFVPPIKGADADGVYTLRTYDDAQTIKAKAGASQRAVLIGGGLLGLEAGNGLRKSGLAVTVVEFFPRLLPRQMDVPGAALLQKQLEEMGFTFYLGAKTQEIVREGPGLTVVLESGERLAADLVLVSAGMRPELTLAQALGLDIDKGVKVDDALRTSKADIYAAGDLVEHQGRIYGIWPACLEQGRVAGENMAGQTASYEGTVPANTLKVVGIDLMAAGDIDADGQLPSVVSKDEARKTYRKLVFKDDVLVGAILLGDLRGSGDIQQAIRKKMDLASLKPELENLGFDVSAWGP